MCARVSRIIDGQFNDCLGGGIVDTADVGVMSEVPLKTDYKD